MIWAWNENQTDKYSQPRNGRGTARFRTHLSRQSGLLSLLLCDLRWVRFGCFTASARKASVLGCGFAFPVSTGRCTPRTRPSRATSTRSLASLAGPAGLRSTRCGGRCTAGRFGRRSRRRPRCCSVGSWSPGPSCCPIRSSCPALGRTSGFRKCGCLYVVRSSASSWTLGGTVGGGSGAFYPVRVSVFGSPGEEIIRNAMINFQDDSRRRLIGFYVVRFLIKK